MPTRAGSAGAGMMPATRRSRTHATQVVNVAAEEAARFGSSHLTRVMREDLRKAHLPPPPLPDADTLAALVQEQKEDERRRHRERDQRAQREYEAYLAGRDGKAQPEYDGDDEALDETLDEHDDVVPVTRNPVRERLEREAAQTRTNRQAQQQRQTQLEREAEIAARSIREAKPKRPPTHERLVTRDPVDNREWFPSDRDRESQLLTDAPAAAEPATNLTARQCTLADVDRLWDWIRADTDTGLRFIGRPMSNSQQLHALMTTIAKGEAQHTSLARSIYVGDAHTGFVVLLPVLVTERMAAVHMYLRADARGLLPSMLPSLLELAADVMPGVKLAVMGMPPSLHKLLHGYGFTMQTVFLQE